MQLQKTTQNSTIYVYISLVDSFRYAQREDNNNNSKKKET